MASLRVLVVDDEALARKRLVRLLSSIPDVLVAGECSSAEEALDRIHEGGVDVVLFDIQMPELSGMEAHGLLPEGGPHVIYVTAHAEHALLAFDLGATDYILKPVEPERLRKALDRVRAKAPAPEAQTPPGAPKRLAFEAEGGLILLAPEEIHYALLEGELVTLKHEGGVLLSTLSLQEVERRVGPGVLFRAHRRILINLDRVRRLEGNESGGYLAHMHDGRTLEVSRQSARLLRQKLGV